MRRVISSPWTAFVLFYVTMIILVGVLDWTNQLLSWSQWLTQAGLITLGVATFGLVGWQWPDLSLQTSEALAFVVGILTVVPATLMGLEPVKNLWPQYFPVASGIAAGGVLGLLSAVLLGMGDNPTIR
jgi:hypothetical protein